MALHEDFKIEQPLAFISIDDPHTFDAVDDGYTFYGGKLVSKNRRMQLERMLSERVVVDGKSVPRWMLAQAPAMKPRDPRIRVTEADDPFYVNVLKDKRGDWFLPDAAWLAEREKRCAALAAKHGAYNQRALDRERAQLVQQRANEARILQAEGAASTTSTAPLSPIDASAAPSPGAPAKKGK